MLNIFRRLFIRYRAFLIASAALLCTFQVVTCAIISSIDLPATIEQFLLFAPPVIRTIIEQSMLGGSAAGILAFTWNHPVTHAVVTAIAIVLGARAVAGEIENGGIELVLAQPVSRVRYLSAHLIFAVSSMVLVSAAGLLGGVIGQRLFELAPFDWDRLLRLLVNLLLLQVSFYSMTLLFSTLGREAGRVASIAVLVAITSYLVQVIATLWNKASFLKPYSLHSYYDPRELLVQGHLAASAVVVLGSFILLAVAAAFARFLTRDLP